MALTVFLNCLNGLLLYVKMDYLSYGYALAIVVGGIIGYVKAGKN